MFGVRRSTFPFLPSFAFVLVMLSAIIVAGGGSRRMGFDKTLALLANRPVIAHTIAAFEATECVVEIVVVGRADRLDELRELIAQHHFGKVREIIVGGAHRQDSVSAGLNRVNASAEFIAVHDAARPLVRPAQILEVLEAARSQGAAALAAPISDTLKRADENGIARESIDRAGVYAMQTPQIFARGLLLEAYQRVAADNVLITDEVSALQHLGREVLLVPNYEVNLKITFPPDLALAEFILARRQEKPSSR